MPRKKDDVSTPKLEAGHDQNGNFCYREEGTGRIVYPDNDGWIRGPVGSNRPFIQGPGCFQVIVGAMAVIAATAACLGAIGFDIVYSEETGTYGMTTIFDGYGVADSPILLLLGFLVIIGLGWFFAHILSDQRLEP